MVTGAWISAEIPLIASCPGVIRIKEYVHFTKSRATARSNDPFDSIILGWTKWKPMSITRTLWHPSSSSFLSRSSYIASSHRFDSLSALNYVGPISTMLSLRWSQTFSDFFLLDVLNPERSTIPAAFVKSRRKSRIRPEGASLHFLLPSVVYFFASTRSRLPAGV